MFHHVKSRARYQTSSLHIEIGDMCQYRDCVPDRNFLWWALNWVRNLVACRNHPCGEEDLTMSLLTQVFVCLQVCGGVF